MKKLQKNLVLICVVLFVLLWISTISAMAGKETVCTRTVGVYMIIPPVKNVYLDANGNINKIVSNVLQGVDCPVTVYNVSGSVVTMTPEIKKQYNELAKVVDFNKVGIRYERGNPQLNTSPINPSPEENTTKHKTNSKVGAKNHEENTNNVRVQIPTRVIFVDGNDLIYGIVSNTPDNEVVLLVRKGGHWLHGSVRIPITEEIRKQYEALLPVVNWNGVGIRYKLDR